MAPAPTRDRPVQAPDGNPLALALATLAFLICFYAWSLLGPLGPSLQEELGLSELEVSVMVAVPVLLGSLMRIPLGALTDRHGGRRVFTALMAFTPLPLVGLALWHESLGVILLLGLLLGFPGASFAVGVPFVNRWYPPERQGFALGIYGMGMGGTVIGGLTAPAIAEAWGLAAPFLAGRRPGGGHGRGLRPPRPRRPPPRGPSGPPASLFAPLAIFQTSGRARALTLFYSSLRRLRGDVPLPPKSPDQRARAHQGGRWGARRGLRAPRRDRPPRRGVVGPARRRERAARVLRGHRGARHGARVRLRRHGPADHRGPPARARPGAGHGRCVQARAQWVPERVGAVTGVVGAAGGLGGFFPPLVMGIVQSLTGSYFLGFVLMALAAVACLVVLRALARPGVAAPARLSATPCLSGSPATTTAGSWRRNDSSGARPRTRPGDGWRPNAS